LRQSIVMTHSFPCMAHVENTFEDRAREKQASRDEDARRLAAGEVLPAELWAENSRLPRSVYDAPIDFEKLPSVADY
jgi:hypothetical protein